MSSKSKRKPRRGTRKARDLSAKQDDVGSNPTHGSKSPPAKNLCRTSSWMRSFSRENFSPRVWCRLSLNDLVLVVDDDHNNHSCVVTYDRFICDNYVGPVVSPDVAVDDVLEYVCNSSTSVPAS